MDLVDSIKKIALNNVLNPDEGDPDYSLRRLQRWFSIHFHTSLTEVEALSTDYLLLHFYEYEFEQLEDKDLDTQLELALETPEERKTREQKEENEDMEYMRIIEEELELGKLEKPTKPKTLKPVEPLPDIEMKIPD
jgi:hypothetical protein